MPVVGPWGGGNKTLTALVERLAKLGHIVTGSLRNDIDVVFCIDPRTSQEGVSYADLRQLTARRGIPLIQRVGDVGTHGKPDLTKLVSWSASQSDSVVFTSDWARDLIEFVGKSTTIPNGATSDFYSVRGVKRSHNQPLRIVTHHWSNNPLKGMEMYERLAREIKDGALAFDFTYIGRSTGALADVTVSPLTGKDLANEVIKGDIYLSASLWEAGANHIVEAMACGLPVVYSVDGGSIPEYCSGRGRSFQTYEQMVSALFETSEDLARHREESLTYTRTIDDAVDDYLEILL
jgi:glycosyltransferase involved in cell wall biosynthesis